MLTYLYQVNFKGLRLIILHRKSRITVLKLLHETKTFSLIMILASGFVEINTVREKHIK